MRNNINIIGNNQTFTYMIEYENGIVSTISHSTLYSTRQNMVWLMRNDVKYYKYGNEWHNVSSLPKSYDYIPDMYDHSNIRLYFPLHSIDTYFKGCNYVLTANTWINGHRVDLGCKVFKRSEALCNPHGVIKNGNNEYYEYVDMEIIDPYELIYSDIWADFRINVCKESNSIKVINNTGSILYITLYAVDNYDDVYLLNNEIIGGTNFFNIIRSSKDYLSLNVETDLQSNGWKFTTSINSQYDSLLKYINETYGLEDVTEDDISYELVLKNKNTLILGPKVKFNGLQQVITMNDVRSRTDANGVNVPIERLGMAEFFKSWGSFSEEWKLVGCLIIKDPTYPDEDAINILSNEIPISQEIFKYFVGSADTQSTQIINPNDMEIINYTLVNKIENKVVHVERPSDTKSNIMQPVFFRVKETEFLTIHPAVTENICINLDDYKSKVEKFILQIEDCTFSQIGSNNFGIIFKVNGKNLPGKATSGLYYVLNENNELVTSGKYKYVM